MPSATKTRTGPIDEAPSPETLDAHVVRPGRRPMIHGYDVEEDLVVHYGLTDTFILTTTGELPKPWQAQAVEVALAFFAPTTIAEAPAHAAVLAQICGARSSAILSVGAVTLAEQTHDLIHRHRDLLDWLDAGEGAPPESCIVQSNEERESVERLRATLSSRHIEMTTLQHDLSRESALLAVLYEAGIRKPELLEILIMTAQFPCVIAEALAWNPRSFREYPMNLPRFEYVEEG